MGKDRCPVCVNLGEICDKVGEGRFCADLFERLEKKEITVEEFTNELLKNKKIADSLRVKD